MGGNLEVPFRGVIWGSSRGHGSEVFEHGPQGVSCTRPLTTQFQMVCIVHCSIPHQLGPKLSFEEGKSAFFGSNNSSKHTHFRGTLGESFMVVEGP